MGGTPRRLGGIYTHQQPKNGSKLVCGISFRQIRAVNVLTLSECDNVGWMMGGGWHNYIHARTPTAKIANEQVDEH